MKRLLKCYLYTRKCKCGATVLFNTKAKDKNKIEVICPECKQITPTSSKRF